MRRATTTLLIREMQRRQTPFWAWTAEEWADLLTLQNAPPQHQRQRAFVRHNLAMIAYLLCDFRTFATAGDWDYVQLASRIFGQSSVDAAVATMLAELTRWGYGERLSKQTVPKVLCEILLVNRSPHLADLTASAFRSLPHLVETVRDLVARGSGFKSLQENIDTTTAGGKLIFHLFASLAEFERDLIRERTNAGLSAARVRGRKGGRPKGVMDERKQKAALALKNDATCSVAEICQSLGICRNTYYKYVRSSASNQGKPGRSGEGMPGAKR
jgi:hypothetical protein